MTDRIQRYTLGIGGLLGLLAAGCSGPVVNGQSARGVALPAQQQKFCDRYNAAYAEYGQLFAAANNEANPIRQQALRTQILGIGPKLLEDEYAIIAATGGFKDWRGMPSFYRSDGSDTLVYSTSACPNGPDNVILQTGTAYFPKPSGRGSTPQSTHILLSSPLGQVLASLDLKKAVIVSGKFIWAVKGAAAGLGDTTMGESDHFLPGGETQGFVSWRSGGAPLMVQFSSIAQAR